MSKQKNFEYVPPCPDIAAFHACEDPVLGIRGPRGGGKSVACQSQIIADALTMPPCEDGVRRSHFLITRASYRDLELSALATWKQRTEGMAGIVPVQGREPWVSGIKMKLPDGTSVDCKVTFQAVPEIDLDKLASQEFTSAILNEASDYTTPDVLSTIRGSLNRYPSKTLFSKEYIEECKREDKPLYRSKLYFDTNPPVDTHWLRKMEDEKPQGISIFAQVPPLLEHNHYVVGSLEHRGVWYTPNPDCKYHNIQAAGYKYWLGLIPGSDDAYIQSRVLGRYSQSVAGKRVYPEFRETLHVSKKRLDPKDYVNNLIIVGIDTSGNHPAAVITTYVEGCFIALDEVHAQDVSFITFVDDYLIPLLASRYSDHEIKAVCDPSNPQSGIDKRTALGICLEAGLDATLASTNFTGDRLEAVKKHLNRLDGFTINPECEALLGGFRGFYAYAPLRGKPGAYKPTPDKSTHYADLHDALQYAALGYDALKSRRSARPVKFTRPRRAA